MLVLITGHISTIAKCMIKSCRIKHPYTYSSTGYMIFLEKALPGLDQTIK